MVGVTSLISSDSTHKTLALIYKPPQNTCTISTTDLYTTSVANNDVAGCQLFR
jgi:hypothetical protein